MTYAGCAGVSARPGSTHGYADTSSPSRTTNGVPDPSGRRPARSVTAHTGAASWSMYASRCAG